MKFLAHPARALLPLPLALSGLLLAPVPAPSAAAQSCVAPPGTSAIDQYCEAIPTTTGERGPTDGGGSGSGRSSRPTVSRQTTRGLAARGRDGAAVLSLTSDRRAVATASRRADRHREPARPGAHRGGVAGVRRPTPGRSANSLNAVTSAVDSGASSGGGFVWALLGVTGSLVAMAWVRFRRR